MPEIKSYNPEGILTVADIKKVLNTGSGSIHTIFHRHPKLRVGEGGNITTQKRFLQWVLERDSRGGHYSDNRKIEIASEFGLTGTLEEIAVKAGIVYRPIGKPGSRLKVKFNRRKYYTTEAALVLFPGLDEEGLIDEAKDRRCYGNDGRVAGWCIERYAAKTLHISSPEGEIPTTSSRDRGSEDPTSLTTNYESPLEDVFSSIGLDSSDPVAKIFEGPLEEVVRYLYSSNPCARNIDWLKELRGITKHIIPDEALKREFCAAINNVPLNGGEHGAYYSLFFEVVSRNRENKERLHDFFVVVYPGINREQYKNTVDYFLASPVFP